MSDKVCPVCDHAPLGEAHSAKYAWCSFCGSLVENHGKQVRKTVVWQLMTPSQLAYIKAKNARPPRPKRKDKPLPETTIAYRRKQASKKFLVDFVRQQVVDAGEDGLTDQELLALVKAAIDEGSLPYHHSYLALRQNIHAAIGDVFFGYDGFMDGFKLDYIWAEEKYRNPEKYQGPRFKGNRTLYTYRPRKEASA